MGAKYGCKIPIVNIFENTRFLPSSDFSCKNSGIRVVDKDIRLFRSKKRTTFVLENLTVDGLKELYHYLLPQYI